MRRNIQNLRAATLGKSLLGITLLGAVLLTGCKAEKKVATYETLFKEKPVTIYTAPIVDQSHRKANKGVAEEKYNAELNTAATYMFQTLATPLNNQGYYVLGTLTSKQIASQEQRSEKDFANGDITAYSQRYGVDAILYTRIHRWIEQNSEWVVFVEYTLRSTKSNTELMHTWVKAYKRIPVDTYGNPVPLKEDSEFAERMGLDDNTAERCLLVEKVSNFVLHNLPTSPNRRQYERDLYAQSNPSYFVLVVERDGGLEVRKSSMESFEEDCFVD